ncbi:MAG: hypothetical protein WBA25_14325 [Jannaschia sp.]
MLTRGENPLSLSVKAARYGAVGFTVGLAILLFPVVQGWRDGAGGPDLDPASPWQALRIMGREMAAEAEISE